MTTPYGIPPPPALQRRRSRTLVMGIIIAGSVLLAMLILGGTAALVGSRTSGPSFGCKIVVLNDGGWQPQISVTGPTPADGLLNVSIVYYNYSHQETGSANDVPLGFSGVTVPAGQTVGYDLTDASDGITYPIPWTCQVAGYM